MTSLIALFHFNDFWSCSLLNKCISSLIRHVIIIKTHLGGPNALTVSLFWWLMTIQLKLTRYSIKSFRSNDIVELALNLCISSNNFKNGPKYHLHKFKKLPLYHCISMGCKVSWIKLWCIWQDISHNKGTSLNAEVGVR